MQSKNVRDLLRTRKEFSLSKAEAKKLDLNPGGPRSPEVKRAIEFSKVVLDNFLQENHQFIKKKLSNFEGFLYEISTEGQTPETTLREILEKSLEDTIVQQYKILNRGGGISSQYSNPADIESIRKTIKALLIEYYLALRVCQKFNETPYYTRRFLGNLHKVDANILQRLTSTFKNTFIPLSYLKTAAYSYRDPEGFIYNILKKFEELKSKYSKYEYITETFLIAVCRNKDPESMLDDYIKKIEATKKAYPWIPYYILIDILRENPNDYNQRVISFVNNTILINEKYPNLTYKAKVVFGKKNLPEKAVIHEIETYLRTCQELEAMFPGIGYYIRQRALYKTKEELIKDFNQFKINTASIINDPRIQNLRKLLPVIYFSYGKENFLENCLTIQNFYEELEKYFYQRDPLFREIRNNFTTDLIRIDYISPNKTLEENILYFNNKIEKFKELKAKFPKYSKYAKLDNRGYISFLIEAIYDSNPEEYLISLGFEL